MTDGEVLEFVGVTKRFGAVAAVSDFSARVEPGVVTGFLGPNGAGKTTSLRILLGLVGATSGRATIGGKEFGDLADPLRSVGAVLEASSFHPGRSAANHLKVYAQAAGLKNDRVDAALAAVGLTDVAGRKVGGFSLGMRQRLGLAFALLGDPKVLVLDEPTNGLDPEGIIWIRGFLRQLAREGRTVLVSSHLLTEVQQTADRLLIIAQGRLVFQGSVGELSDPSEQAIVIDSPDRGALSAALTDAGVPFENLRSGLTVRGGDAASLGAIALAAGVPLSGLTKRGPSIEEVFLDLVSGVRAHASAGGGAAALVAADTVEPSELAQPEEPAEPAEVAEPATVAEFGEAEAIDEAVEIDLADETAEADAETAADDSGDDPDELEVADEVIQVSTAAFTVASTGVIDVIPPADDAAPETPSEPTAVSAESEPEPEPEPDPGEHPHFAVAATGVIDVIGQDAAEPDVAAPDVTESEDVDGEGGPR